MKKFLWIILISIPLLFIFNLIAMRDGILSTVISIIIAIVLAIFIILWMKLITD